MTIVGLGAAGTGGVRTLLSRVGITNGKSGDGQKEERMKFARVVYWVAGIWGILLITPLYFMFELIGRKDPPAITHPGFYYGFVGVALAWQIAFLVIARDPARMRPM